MPQEKSTPESEAEEAVASREDFKKLTFGQKVMKINKQLYRAC